MLHTTKLSASSIQKQPSELNFHNLANVCSLCVKSRVAVDTVKEHAYYWAANMPIEEAVSAISVDMQKPRYNEELQELEIFPIVYRVSEQERENMRNVLELEDKYFLNGALLNYRSLKSMSKDVNIKEMNIGQKEGLLKVDYSIFLEQTVDGNPYTIQEIVLYMIIGALNQHRRIQYIPHETLPIKIVIPRSIIDIMKEEEEAAGVKTLMPTESRLTDYILNKLDGSGDDEATPMFSKIKRELVYFDIVNDKTERAVYEKFPLPYVEIRKCYMNSFDINKYRVL